MIKDYFNLAFKNIRKRGLRSWLTMIGIFIGIAAVVSLIGLGEGLREAINSQFGFLGTNYITITATGGFGPPGTGVIDPLTDKEMGAIEKVAGVDGVASRIIVSGKLEFNGKVGFGYAVSMPDGEQRELIHDAINLEAERGRLLKDGDKRNVVIGYNFLEEDNGFDKPILPGAKVLINDFEFEVIGVLEKKGNFQIDQAVLINDDVLREIAEREKGIYDVIVARTDENADMNQIKKDIEKALRKIRDVEEGREDFSVSTPEQILQGVNDILLGIQIFIGIIAGISLLVGGIGIMNTMYTAVVERTKEIGIMKSIGAKNNVVFLLFFIESGLLGSVGGIVGALIGAGLAYGLAFVGQLVLGSGLISASISPNLMFGAIAFSFIMGSFFGTLPALQAAKLNPVDALRKVK